MMEQQAPADVPASGEVITFYSYKGGVGRSMALANVACVLASRKPERGVLMVDWDLEAPGLHRFFADHVRDRKGLIEAPGVIDLFEELDAGTREIASLEELEREDATHELLTRVKIERFIQHTSIPSLDLLKAGRFDDDYARRVAAFRWDSFHQRTPWLFAMLAERLAEEYSYVLIDSRTGLSDVSGICATLLPEKLVTVFTPNRQSLDGLDALISRATEYRRNSSDLRPLKVYPLPSRIEASLDKLRADWRYGNSGQNIEGYQPLFDGALRKSYGRLPWNPDDYFNQVQIQQVPDYAYGERIAVLDERGQDVFSLTASYERFTQWLVGQPEQRAPRKDEERTSPAAEDATLLVEKAAVEEKANRSAAQRLSLGYQILNVSVIVLAAAVAAGSAYWPTGVIALLAAAVAIMAALGVLFGLQGRAQVHLSQAQEYARARFEIERLIVEAGSRSGADKGFVSALMEQTEKLSRLQSTSVTAPSARDYRTAMAEYGPARPFNAGTKPQA